MCPKQAQSYVTKVYMCVPRQIDVFSLCLEEEHVSVNVDKEVFNLNSFFSIRDPFHSCITWYK